MQILLPRESQNSMQSSICRIMALYLLGLSEREPLCFTVTVPCYNAERILCDLFRTDMETQEKQFVVKEYLRGKKNLPRFMEYAKILRVKKRMKKYREVLL